MEKEKIEMALLEAGQQKIIFPVVVPNMANQVAFEGFLARAWMHDNTRYLRLANHRPPQAGTQSDGPLMVESDYVTIRLDPSVPFDMARADPGLRLIARGRIEGHDIPETIGDILRHCNLNVRIPQDIAHLTVSRPAVQIYCTYLEFFRDQAGRNSQNQKSHRPSRSTNRPYPGARVGRRGGQPNRQQLAGPAGKVADRQVNNPQGNSTLEFAPPIIPSMKDATPDPNGVQPGQDVSELADRIEASRGRKDEPSSPREEKSIKASRKNLSNKKAAAGAAPENPETTHTIRKEPKARKTAG
jgi:hypothetical protein